MTFSGGLETILSIGLFAAVAREDQELYLGQELLAYVHACLELAMDEVTLFITEVSALYFSGACDTGAGIIFPRII